MKFHCKTISILTLGICIMMRLAIIKLVISSSVAYLKTCIFIIAACYIL